MTEDLPADVLLVGFRQSLDFRYGSLQSVRHGAKYTMPKVSNPTTPLQGLNSL